MGKCDCGKMTRVHYNGKEYCDECFHNVYTKPLLASMTDEERARAMMIGRNFIRNRKNMEKKKYEAQRHTIMIVEDKQRAKWYLYGAIPVLGLWLLSLLQR